MLMLMTPLTLLFIGGHVTTRTVTGAFMCAYIYTTTIINIAIIIAIGWHL